jgi:hypothetical protein
MPLFFFEPSPGHVAGIEKTAIRGRPDKDLISTS